MLSLCIVLLAAPRTAPPGADASAAWRLSEVAPGVYAALGRAVPVNTAVIIGDDGVIVVDSGLTPESARALLEEIRDLTPKPVRVIINTHSAPQHHYGNRTLLGAYPGAEIIAHESTAAAIHASIAELQHSLESSPELFEDILRDEARLASPQLDTSSAARLSESIREQKALYRALPAIEIAEPTMTFAKTLTLRRGSRTIELRWLSEASTTVVYLPAEKVLFSGPLFSGRVDFGASSPQAYLGAIREMETWGVEAVVGSRGPVHCAREQFRSMETALEAMVREAVRLRKSGSSLEQALRCFDASRYAPVMDEATARAGLERAFRELQASAALCLGCAFRS